MVSGRYRTEVVNTDDVCVSLCQYVPPPSTLRDTAGSLRVLLLWQLVDGYLIPASPTKSQRPPGHFTNNLTVTPLCPNTQLYHWRPPASDTGVTVESFGCSTLIVNLWQFFCQRCFCYYYYYYYYVYWELTAKTPTWWWLMFYGHFCAHVKLNGPNDLQR